MLALALLPILLSWPQEPLRIGVIANQAADAADVPFVRGVQRAAAAINSKGGVDGAPIALVFAAAATPGGVRAAMAELQTAGVCAVVPPPGGLLSEAVKKESVKDKKNVLPCVTFDAAPEDIAKVIDAVVADNFQMTRVGLVRDQSKGARALGKWLEKGGLTAPTTLVFELDVTAPAKVVQKQFEKDPAQLLVIDAEPEAAAKFVAEGLGSTPMTIVLTPRTYGEPMLRSGRILHVVYGLSPGAVATKSAFRSEYERDHGVPGFGAAEGYEAIAALARAFDAADSREGAAVQAALALAPVDGIRGSYGYDKVLAAFVPPLGMWKFAGGPDLRLSPYVPVAVPPVATIVAEGTAAGATEGTAATSASEPRKPQTKIGVPFGTWRTRRLQWEEGAQWVICEWADDGGYATIDADLAQLGLSTSGKDPLLDHLVRQEILARVVAITSTKFGRNEDGTGIPRKSLRICFGTDLSAKERQKKKQRLWPARFGGDHPDAGGEAFGTFCRVYSFFIRRTIFQAHALPTGVTPADCAFLDGSYVFGTDYDLDKRSELIRALINGYAGSMALTLAHEVGHLASLGHVNDDPVEIMNVDEGAGIDYPEARFGAGSWQILEKRLGIFDGNQTKAR